MDHPESLGEALEIAAQLAQSTGKARFVFQDVNDVWCVNLLPPVPAANVTDFWKVDHVGYKR